MRTVATLLLLLLSVQAQAVVVDKDLFEERFKNGVGELLTDGKYFIVSSVLKQEDADKNPTLPLRDRNCLLKAMVEEREIIFFRVCLDEIRASGPLLVLMRIPVLQHLSADKYVQSNWRLREKMDIDLNKLSFASNNDKMAPKFKQLIDPQVGQSDIKKTYIMAPAEFELDSKGSKVTIPVHYFFGEVELSRE